MMYFHVCPAKHLNPPKLWKLLAIKPYLYCFGGFHPNVGGVRSELRTTNKLPHA
jgi:hypothetical protein